VPKISRSAATSSNQEPYWTKLPDRKITWVAYLLLLMGGGGLLGFHRFYLGYKRSAKLQLALGVTVFLLPFFASRNLLTEALFYAALVWYFVDIFLIPGMLRAANSRAVPAEGRSE
jgi:TM2 domain-containing membrane protein YozV